MLCSLTIRPLGAWSLLAFALAAAHGAEAQTAELAKLLASDGSSADSFGYAVSVSGERALVGAYLDDDQGYGTGSAYVFERGLDGAWTQVAKLVADDAAADDFFGSAVALSGSRALVGASDDEDLGYDSGSAYVFERSDDGTWAQAAKLLASDGTTGDFFGFAVSLAGERALVGSFRDDDRASDAGAAYVFERRGDGAWVETAKLVASDGAPSDYFGISVSIEAGQALIGAYVDDDQGRDSGSAYVFERGADGTWTQAAKLLASNGAQGAFFGASVAIGKDRGLVGAWGGRNKGSMTGASYVFERQSDGAWVEVERLLASDAGPGDFLGWSVALSGDRALVGAPGVGAFDRGAAYSFERRSDGSWLEVAKIEASDVANQDSFGQAVALAADRGLIGAPEDDDMGARSGSAYTFDLLPLSSMVQEVSLSAGGTQPLELDAGRLHAGEAYWMLGSASGTSPGLALGGVVLPLNPDAYFARTLEFPNRPPLSGSRGFLNPAGHANARFSILPNELDLVGLTVHHAFVTLGNPPAGRQPTFVSNAFPVVLVP